MSDSINYGNLMHRAMRGLIAEVLTDVSENGLPGDHHFFVTFDTTHPDVDIADWLFDRYPSEMTVVIQHWFEDLIVGPDGFRITLNFGDNPEPLSIPFLAIRTFVDPSVEFGLRFETQDDDEDAEIVEIPEIGISEDQDLRDIEAALSDAVNSGEDEKPAPSEKKAADVVSLDQFRK